jgi:hypothetical protein
MEHSLRLALCICGIDARFGLQMACDAAAAAAVAAAVQDVTAKHDKELQAAAEDKHMAVERAKQEAASKLAEALAESNREAAAGTSPKSQVADVMWTEAAFDIVAHFLLLVSSGSGPSGARAKQEASRGRDCPRR